MCIILVLFKQKDSHLKYTAFVCLLSSRLLFFSAAILTLFASYINLVASHNQATNFKVSTSQENHC